jgi:hypothetical protein
MKLLTFALCLLLYVGSPRSKSTYFHLMELNHFYGRDGKHVYSQVILWHQNPATMRLEVGYWSLADTEPLLENGLYKWTDKEGRAAHSRIFRESWSQIDPERANQKRLDQESRIGFPVTPKEQP